uniref:CCHC-type domain-containing protein n=1 Tax=Oryza punctata TaxID=4537 RepID=A0A0E0L0L4_ORYPU
MDAVDSTAIPDATDAPTVSLAADAGRDASSDASSELEPKSKSSLSYRREANVICEDCEEQGHCATNCPWNVYARTPTKEEMKCLRRNQAPSRFVRRNYGTPQSNPKKRKTILWKMDDGKSMTITGTEFTPEDATRIPRRLRVYTFRGARQLTQYFKWYGQPKPGCHEPEEMLYDDDDDDGDAILDSFGKKERELKACTSCREVGHIASRCTQTFLRGEDIHSPDDCPMRNITGFLCEGTGHVPKNCQLNLVLTKTKEDQRTSLQPVYPPMTLRIAPLLIYIQLQLQLRLPMVAKVLPRRFMSPHLTPVPVVSVQAQDIKQLRSTQREFCLELGHHINKCPFPRQVKFLHYCFNLGKPGHISKGYPMPKCQPHQAITNTIYNTLTPPLASAPIASGLIQPKNTRKTSDNNYHLNGTVKGRILPLVTASNLRSQHRQGKQCLGNNSSPQLQRDSTLLQQYQQQVSPAPVHKTAIKFSNTPCVATIQMSSSKPQNGGTLSEKVLPTSAA